ncbi:hypothetical protein [Haloplanus sp.]|uniref:hypothetical protein n=1 Tax=Haloplanus sp. TaxID=1961696 RepID=UPI0026070548|nr:hypothetical protein [Haloplanus sp.]
MTNESSAGTADTMRARADNSGPVLWLLMRTDRLLLVAGLTLLVFIGFVVVVDAVVPSFAARVESSDPIETIFSTMIGVVVTGTTLVVTIGQLVLTQENGPLGDQRGRMDGTMAFRRDLETLLGSPVPAEPAAFLSVLLGAVADRSRTLQESADTAGTDPDLRGEINAFTEGTVENAADVRGRLTDAEFGSFDVLFAALDFDYGPKLVRIERIVDTHDDLTAHQRGLLDDLTTALSLFGPAREHIKTLYFQWALIELSRRILYAAVPALVVASVTLVGVDAGTAPGSTLGVDHLVVVVGGALAVTLVPFILFISYILRILTVAKRTLAIGPLVLRDS